MVRWQVYMLPPTKLLFVGSGNALLPAWRLWLPSWRDPMVPGRALRATMPASCIPLEPHP